MKLNKGQVSNCTCTSADCPYFQRRILFKKAMGKYEDMLHSYTPGWYPRAGAEWKGIIAYMGSPKKVAV